VDKKRMAAGVAVVNPRFVTPVSFFLEFPYRMRKSGFKIPDHV
jgi:hypothetical protein